MTTFPYRVHSRSPHLNPWLLAVVALAAALVGLSAWVIVDQTQSDTKPAAAPVHGLASPSVAAMLGNRISAFNRGGGEPLARFYTPNALLDERDVAPPMLTLGNHKIGARINGLWDLGLRLKSESPVIQLGPYAAEAVSMPGSTSYAWILVYQLGQKGKIEHQWVIGGSR